ncbi:13488_t:CDS:2, partial [Entrophospora sp. SA101]
DLKVNDNDGGDDNNVELMVLVVELLKGEIESEKQPRHQNEFQPDVTSHSTCSADVMTSITDSDIIKYPTHLSNNL